MDPFLIIVAVALGLFVFMQFRTAKKRRAAASDLQEKMVAGAEVMTNYGLYGTVISINDETNEALIETTPGTVLRIHRQTILKVVEDEVEAVEETVEGEESETVDQLEAAEPVDPAFGERVVEEKKAARKSAEKGEE